MKRVAANFIPKLLNPNQKENRMLICQHMKQSLADDPDLSKIITGDETWVYGYDPELKFSHHSGRVLVLLGLRRHRSLGPGESVVDCTFRY